MGIEQYLEQRFRNEGFKLGEQAGLEKGIEIGLEKASFEQKIVFTRKLLTATDFSIEKIADMAGVSVDFVEEVKATLK